MLDIKLQLNLGELEEPSLVFPELAEEEPPDLDRELSETCAEEEECLHQPKSGEDGTEDHLSTKEDTL
jgi:hypothetical protein